ncbi:ABC transporter permease [Caballeronia sp. DA-9]|uniref:ABC transporter permease n=1 Tax=Caballeronia sp. DA-9 TaxID=3436237 RepID=UPI003F66B03C
MTGRHGFSRLSYSGFLALTVLVIFVFTAILAPLVAPYGLNTTVGDVWEPITRGHPFGTDSLGRDLLSRLIFGAQITLLVAGSSTVLAFFIGMFFGFLASVVGGWLEQVLSRINDLMMSIPTLILALVVLAIVPINLFTLIVVMAVLDSTRVYRLARSLASEIVVMEYVEVARLRGERFAWVMLREVLPNALAPLIAEFALRFAFAILFLSALSFLGLGVQPPNADWGSLVRENKDGIIFGVPAALIPGFAIAILAFAANTLADKLIGQSARLRKE